VARRSASWLVRCSPGFLSYQDTPLSDEAKVLFLILDSFARTEPYCFPGNARLTMMAGKKTRAVQLVLTQLEQAGWIRRVFFDGKKIDRMGVILLRRADPSMPAAASDEEITAATSELRRSLDERIGAQNIAPSRAQYFAGYWAQKNAPELSSAARKQQRKEENAPDAARGASAHAASGRKKKHLNDGDLHNLVCGIVRRMISEGKDEDDIYGEVFDTSSENYSGIDTSSDRFWQLAEKALNETLGHTKEHNS